MEKIRIFNRAYRPFIMGGDVHGFISTDVDVTETFIVNDFITLYEVRGPDGKTAIVEAISGGIVGNSLNKVLKDIETAEPDVMKEQIKGACEMAKRADHVSETEFWKYFRK